MQKRIWVRHGFVTEEDYAQLRPLEQQAARLYQTILANQKTGVTINPTDLQQLESLVDQLRQSAYILAKKTSPSVAILNILHLRILLKQQLG